MAVDYFFILSGFVLTHMLLSRPLGPIRFFIKRLTRLWPLHAATTLLIFCLFINNRIHQQYYPANIPLNGWTLAYNLSFFSGTDFTQVGMLNNPAWSISVEFWVSGLLMYWLVKLPPAWLLGVAALIYGGIFRGGHGLEATYEWTFHLPDVMLRGLAGMVAGVALYKLRPHLERCWRLLPLAASTALLSAAAAIIAWELYTGTGRYRDAIPLLAIIPFFMLGEEPAEAGLVGNLLCLWPFQWLGRVSFALYLVHTSVIILCAPGSYRPYLGLWPTAFLFLGASLLAAEALERCLAKPARPALAAG
jgi:peptidoglycan/LPS O-acetylase OafA/YrhL